MNRPIRLAVIATALCLLSPAAVSWAKPGTPQVKLLDAGKGKKKKLRYQAEAGAKEKMQMDMDMNIGMSMGGQAVMDMRAPKMRMTADIEVTEVTKQGAMRYRFRYTDVDVLDTPGVAPAMKTTMEQAVKDIESLGGTALVSDRGIMIEGNFDTDGISNPQVQQLTASLEQSMQQLSAPLPVQAVGRGAKWEVRSHIENGGIDIQQVARYELIELRADGFKCKVEITQSAKPQTIQDPNLPPSAKVELVTMKGNGSGEMNVSLGRFTPTSKARMSSDMKMRMQMGGQTQEMEMRMTMELDVKPVR